jgi:5-methylcytosine-specific restriction endonuclease McrA
MAKFELNRRTELVGKTFGKLTVVSPGPIKGNTKRSFWLCKCTCGNETNVRESCLLDGNTWSCGCLRGQRIHSDTNPSLSLLRDTWEAATVWRLYQYKHSAKNRGLDFSIPDSVFIDLVQKSCHYCGAPPSNIAKVSTRKHRNGEVIYSGLDRIDNTKGYTPENVVPCCINCNRAKRTMTRDAFLTWVSRVYMHSVIKAENPEV